MANVLIFNICLLSLLSRVEPCYLPQSLHVRVPLRIPARYQLMTVEAADCDSESVRFSISDSSFQIHGDGSVVAVAPLTVPPAGRTFSVSAQDDKGPRGDTIIHLHSTQLQTGILRRVKRRWSPPPFNILENDVGPFPKEIERIVSDSESRHNVYYTLSGHGFNLHPVGVFGFNSTSAMLSVLKPVDREEFPNFTLKTDVYDRVTNRPTDDPLYIKVDVDDVNDNNPQFEGLQQFTVLEQSNAGATVGTVNATDRDKPGTLHVKIRYSLLSGTDLFAINPKTGVITTVTNSLDREVKDKYTVTVQIKDMDGAVNGLSTTGTATITLGDINDNPPTFTKQSYEASVKENENGKVVLRIPVEDKDLVNTPNWISQFVITKGNENGNFRMETDPKTNEGLLHIAKPLNYETTKNLKLQIMARNVADLSGTKAQWQSIPVDLTVSDVDEGPEFTAPTVHFPVKENAPNGTLIGTYTAVDPETRSSDGIKYYKVTDPAAWINVDKNTGELKVANTIDRESHHVHDGIYNITVRAVDASSKTGTGTVVILVEDDNDNAPHLPDNELVVCEREDELGSVLITAEDGDQSPFASPFSFSLPDDLSGKWSVTRLNDTTATLQQVKALPAGIYKLPVEVTDLQGFSKPQTANVRICQCRNGVCLPKPLSASLGSMALLAMLLPLFLLLLLCLLLILFCATKREKVEVDDGGDSGGILIKSNTEAPGDEVDSSFIVVPAYNADGGIKGSTKDGAWQGLMDAEENGMQKTEIVTTDVRDFSSGQYESHLGAQQLNGGYNTLGYNKRYMVQESALLHTWQTNGRYLHQKLGYLGTEEDGRYADDIVHSYKFEGTGSAAGSVGCCSDFGDNDNLDFLNTLGPKFKTLSSICKKT